MSNKWDLKFIIFLSLFISTVNPSVFKLSDDKCYYKLTPFTDAQKTIICAFIPILKIGLAIEIVNYAVNFSQYKNKIIAKIFLREGK